MLSWQCLFKKQSFVLLKYPVFIMAMTFTIHLVVTMYIVIYNFNKLTFLYTHVHTSILLL